MANSESADLRRWAVEQAIKVHGANGATLAVVLDDAERLRLWVAGSGDPLTTFKSQD